jgi:hypothetical protein
MSKSKWDRVSSRFHEIEKWLRDGLTEKQICKNIGVSESVFAEYKHIHPELVEVIKRGKASIVSEIENALVKRALGFEYEEVKTYIKTEDGKAVTYTEKTRKYLPPDVGACAILLKNKSPNEYTNDKAALELKKQELELRKMIEETKAW